MTRSPHESCQHEDRHRHDSLVRMGAALLTLVVFLVAFGCAVPPAFLGRTTRVGVSSAGAEANGRSLDPHISDEGPIVAFSSAATNLVDDDTNGESDVFVRDLGG